MVNASQRRIDGIVERVLHGANPGIRTDAVGELALDHERSLATKALVKACGSGASETRVWGIHALAVVGDGKASRAIEASLNTADSNVIAAAAGAVEKLKLSSAVPALCRTLAAPRPCSEIEILTTMAVLSALCSLRDKSSTKAVLPYLSSVEPRVRCVAIRAVGACGGAETIGELAKGLKDHDRNVIWATLEALEGIGPPALDTILGALGSLNSDVRNGAIRALGNLGEGAVSHLSAIVQGNNPEASQAVRALAKIGSPAAENLISLLPDSREEVRVAIFEALGQVEDTRVLEVLLHLVEADPKSVEVAAIDAIAQNGSPRALEALLKLARTNQQRIQVAAAYGLGSSKDPRALETLSELLRSRKEEVQIAAASALGTLPQPEVIEVLGSMLDTTTEDDFRVNCAIVAALTRRGPSAIAVLCHALENGDSRIRNQSAMALADVGDPTAIPSLKRASNDEDPFVRVNVETALIRIRKRFESDS